MSFGSKDYSIMHPVSCTNTHHAVSDLVKNGKEIMGRLKMQKLEYLENGR